ncbi:MAG: chemotaxis protein CheD [Oceanidesulfovibrio sp.]
MSMLVIGVGGIGLANGDHEGVKTFALGSCVAVMLHDPAGGFVGMVHVALPDSSTNRSRASALPGYFADTGINELLKQTAQMRGGKRPNSLMVKLVGGASIIKSSANFNIGKRNSEAVMKHLSERGLRIAAADLGGHLSRTVSIEQGSGRVEVTSPGRPTWEL